MCGFAGILGFDGLSEDAPGVVRRMAAALHHRGPDDFGEWVDSGAGIALGFRRLSIVDLSPAGHQPMVSHDGRFVAVFNGEIYNCGELRQALKRDGIEPPWRGHSDTEVFLEAIANWGLERALQEAVGMFALAVWDRQSRRLSLARDRVGEKPLYFGRVGGALVFASELKAFRAHPSWEGKIDRGALGLLLKSNCIPAPSTIYRDVFKLLPGSWLEIGKPSDILENGRPRTPESYWSPFGETASGRVGQLIDDEPGNISLLDATLRKAVAGQMVADVPLGAFLSGGVDSSTIVALMQAQSSRAVRTFTIGFRESEFDEAVYAREVARHLGTDHTELYVTPAEAQQVIPSLPDIYDEPFADSSQIPTYLVSRLARSHVTVSLSGDGGDELFGGYNRYFWGRNLWRWLGRVPVPIRHGVGVGMRSLSPQSWDRLLHAGRWALPSGLRQMAAGDKVHKLAGILSVRSPDELYDRLITHWGRPEDIVIGCPPLDDLEPRSQADRLLSDFTDRMMYRDLRGYLPDDILVKVDRASMAVSLESRAPFLDHRVVELAWRLPLDQKIRNGQGKWLLRQLLYRYVPKELIERPKMGFGVPLDSWLRGPLRDWAEDMLDEGRLRREGYFHPEPIRRKWTEHVSGARNWQYHLWDVLMFQAWLERERSASKAYP